MEHQDWEHITLKSKKDKPDNKYDGPKVVSSQPKYKEDESGIPIKKSFPKDFGQKMQQARSAKGWSQKELATKLNVALTVVQEYEQNKVANPNRTFARKIEKVLGGDLF